MTRRPTHFCSPRDESRTRYREELDRTEASKLFACVHGRPYAACRLLQSKRTTSTTHGRPNPAHNTKRRTSTSCVSMRVSVPVKARSTELLRVRGTSAAEAAGAVFCRIAPAERFAPTQMARTSRVVIARRRGSEKPAPCEHAAASRMLENAITGRSRSFTARAASHHSSRKER